MQAKVKDIIIQGLWKNNPAIVQLLGLCPLLAVSNSVVNAVGLGLTTCLVLMFSNILIAIFKNYIPHEVRIPIFIMIISALVTCVELFMNGFFHHLYVSLGIYLPLIVTNCIIIGRSEAFAAKNTVLLSALDGLMMGLGFSLVLFFLGMIRELLGNGTLFDGAELLLGSWAKSLTIYVYHFDYPFLLALLPPGAFFCVGFMIALKNVIQTYLQNQYYKPEQKTVVERVRLTDKN